PGPHSHSPRPSPRPRSSGSARRPPRPPRSARRRRGGRRDRPSWTFCRGLWLRGAELFAPALLLLDVLVVGELFEIGLVGDPPYLEDDSRTHRCPTRPLGGLVLRRDIEDPEPVEQLVDLPVRAVRDDGLLAVVVD